MNKIANGWETRLDDGFLAGRRHELELQENNHSCREDAKKEIYAARHRERSKIEGNERVEDYDLQELLRPGVTLGHDPISMLSGLMP